jgi:hypothetical protein
MPTPYRIVDLSSYLGLPNGLPTGAELAEISNGGSGSFQIPIAVLSSARNANIMSVGGTFNLIAGNYGDIFVTSTSAVTIQLPLSSFRNGVPVTVIAAQSTVPNITVLPNGTDTILGLASITITTPWAAFNLWPLPAYFNPGGWFQK